MAVGRSDGVQRAGVRMRGVDFEGLSDFGKVEAVAVDDDGDAVHGRGVEFGVANLVCGAVRSQQVNVVAIAGVVVATEDAEVRNGDGAILALERAASVMDFNLAGRFLVAFVAELATFLEVSEFLRGGADGMVRAVHGLRGLKDRGGGNVVDEGAPAIGGSELTDGVVPRRSLGWVPSVVAGKLLGGSVPNGLVRGGGSRCEVAREDGAVNGSGVGGCRGSGQRVVKVGKGNVFRGGSWSGGRGGTRYRRRGDGSIGFGGRRGHGEDLRGLEDRGG